MVAHKRRRGHVLAVSVATALGVQLWTGVAFAAAPVPAPSQPPGSEVTAWTCQDRNGPSPYPTTSSTPMPVADAAPGVTSPSPAPTTVMVYGRLGQDCAATAYGLPAPGPTVYVSHSPVVAQLPLCGASPAPTSSSAATSSPDPAPTSLAAGGGPLQYGVDCSLSAQLSDGQAVPLLLLLGILTMLAVAALIWRAGRPVRL